MCGEYLEEDDETCPYCGAALEMEEEEIIEALKRLSSGDIIISRSGTERTVLSVDGDQIKVRAKMPGGNVKESEIDLNVLILRANAIEKVIPGEKVEFEVEENVCQECGEEVDGVTEICPGCGVQLWEEKDEAGEGPSVSTEKTVPEEDKPDENIKRKIETLLLEAVLASTNKDYIGSLKACDAALELWSNNPNAWYLKGVAYTAMGLSEMAEKCIDESIHFSKDINSFNQQVIIPTTSLIRERRNINEIQKFLEKGSLHASKEEYDLSLKSYDKVISLDPVNADAWYLKAVVYTAMGITDMAKGCLAESAMIRRKTGERSKDFIKKIKKSSVVLEKEIERIPTFEIIEEVQFQCSDCGTVIDENDSRCPNCGVKFKTQTYKEETDESEYDLSNHGYFDFEGRLF
ncbi:MAG: zinc ribbon domain-containing protein [Candidatus Thermoplasmatota archaeon]|nr:zinc ribbon domain-containing protein [Candidatus Thermoplasmatota archaeon]